MLISHILRHAYYSKYWMLFFVATNQARLISIFGIFYCHHNYTLQNLGYLIQTVLPDEVKFLSLEWSHYHLLVYVDIDQTGCESICLSRYHP